jgi:hypothetical protein
MLATRVIHDRKHRLKTAAADLPPHHSPRTSIFSVAVPASAKKK